MMILSKVVEEASISHDAIIGAIVGIVGVVLGWLLSELTEVIKQKIGKFDIRELRSWGMDAIKDSSGFYKSIKICSVIQIQNNKNIIGCAYGWKVHICANGKKYSYDIYNSLAQDNKVVDVVTVQPKEVKQIILESIVPFHTLAVFYDKYDNLKKENYSGIGRIKKIDNIEIVYRCNFDKKEHIVCANKFIVEK